MAVSEGGHVGPYRIERLLARGGMGEVYLATDEALGRPVALKLLPAELAEDPAFRQRFLAESRLAASLDHPHIVPIYEAGETDGRLFIAMRYVEGSDLGTLIGRDGPLGPGRALGLLRGVADALDAAHDRGLVHRDVKPGNILVTPTARGGEHAYLADFGLVKQLGSGADFTQTGQLLGSVGYVAPEQIEGRPIDARADVYSLACVLFEALTGRPPFPAERDVATLWAHLQAPRPRASEILPELAPLDAVLARGMAVDPAERYGSAGELVGAASDVLDDDTGPGASLTRSDDAAVAAGGVVAPGGLPAKRTPRMRTSRQVTLIGALALVAVAAIALSAFRLGSKTSSVPLGPDASAGTTVSSLAAVQTTTASGAFPDPHESALLARLPPSVAQLCTRGPDPRTPSAISLHCGLPPDQKPDDLFLVWYWGYPSTARSRVEAEIEKRQLPDQSCDSAAGGHEEWRSGSETLGVVACFRTTINEAAIMWSVDKDGVVGSAFMRDGQPPEIHSWWQQAAGYLIALAPGSS